VDCHFEQDSHGGGKLYGESRAAIELDCVDCHGTIAQRAPLVTSGPAAPSGGTHLAALRTPWLERRFEWRDGKLYTVTDSPPGPPRPLAPSDTFLRSVMKHIGSHSP
jgi:hypothetical protein